MQSHPVRLTILVSLLVLAANPALLAAQGARLVRGTVADSARSPLPGAFVAPAGAADRARAVAGTTGAFTLRLPSGESLLVAARIGFAPETLGVGPATAAVAFRLRAAPVTIDPIAVAADRSFSAASSAVIRQIDVALRPRESSQELLRLVPGLVIAQHAGGGKAEQIFLRGFDADHGTDVAVGVDGTPVNMVSHAHGQGYADLHFLIPEVVDGAEVRKGPYDARDGDFATAGAVEFRTLDRLATRQPLVQARDGSFGTAHTLALVPLGGEAGQPGGYLAAAGHLSNGPFESPQSYRRYNVFGKWTMPLGREAELVATASTFGARWDASGQIPERAVRAGLVSRFGSIDPTEGGFTGRQELSVGARSVAGEAQWDARLYAVRYRFTLYSNFTFYLNDSLNGDGIGQHDDRLMLGFQSSYARQAPLFGREGRWDVGVGARTDRADVELFHQRRRARLEPRVDDRMRQVQVYGWAREAVTLTSRLRAEVAVRADIFRFEVRDRLVGLDTLRPHGSGVAWRGVLSPKASLAFRAGRGTELFLNGGAGFHSNDARDVVLAAAGRRVLPRAAGVELGARRTWAAGSVAAALWGLDLQSELVYVGDEGTTEASGRTRRVGIDGEGRLRLAPWLWVDADVNFSRGRFRDAPRGADYVPLAPTLTSTGGLTVRDVGAFSGGLRYRVVRSRPADETATVIARGYTQVEMFGAARFGRIEVALAVDNLLGAVWNEAQFATTSRLPGETTAVTELHFTPGAPRAVQVGVRYAI